MGFVKGIDAIKAAVDNSNRDFDETPKAKWLSLKDGQSVRINFLQEFDENSEQFSPKNGTLLVAVEHSAPHNFRKKALCTADEGPCLPCEINKAKPKTGWNQKQRLYANVLVTEGEQEPYVAVLSQGLGGKSITPTLIEAANIYGSITKNDFRMKRSGSQMNSTSYNLIPLPGEASIDVEAYELYDLEQVATRKIPYEDQAAFYEVEEAAAEEPSGESGSDFEW